MAEVLTGVNGNILKWAREFYNMSLEEAATAIGVDYENIVAGKMDLIFLHMQSSEK